MYYSKPFVLEPSVCAAWDSGLAEFRESPQLSDALMSGRAALLPRFAACYVQFRALPRGARRALVRRLNRSPQLNYFFQRRGEARALLARSAAGTALLLALIQSADAATITVTTNAPGINDLDGRCSLIEAIINANGDAATHADCAAGSGADTIVLPKGSQSLTSSYTDYAGATGLPVITSEITIAGNRTKIALAKTAAPFRVLAVAASGNLTLNDVTISGGAADKGGAILNYGTLTINDSIISGNTASARGGAIYSRDASAHVVINDSRLTGNQAANGGAIFSYQYVLIADSLLSGNTASGEGGAIANYDGYLRIDHSTISKNRATRAAAGIDNVYGTAKIFDSIITGNSAMYGGGIENYADSTTVSKLYIYHSTVSKNGAGVYAGGIANINGYLKLADSTVSGNKANDRGGGVFNHGTATFTSTNSTIAKNKAPNGADVYP